MESTIRYILLIIGFLILLGILLDGINRNRKKNKMVVDINRGKQTPDLNEKPILNITSLEKPISKSVLHEEKSNLNSNNPSLDEIISLRIMALQNKKFGGYHLLQTLLANNLHYGPMQIFHYYSDAEYKHTLFNLVSASEPGDFDLNNIGNFFCPGIILFMDTKQLDNPLSAFDQMLDIAKQLADDLNGKIELEKDKEATFEDIESIRKKLGANSKLE